MGCNLIIAAHVPGNLSGAWHVMFRRQAGVGRYFFSMVFSSRAAK